MRPIWPPARRPPPSATGWTLTPDRVTAMAAAVEDVAALPDPLARDLGEWTRPNGLRIRRVATPIGRDRDGL